MSRRFDKTKYVWVVNVDSYIWGVFSSEKKAYKATAKLDDAAIKYSTNPYQVDWRIMIPDYKASK